MKIEPLTGWEKGTGPFFYTIWQTHKSKGWGRYGFTLGPFNFYLTITF